MGGGVVTCQQINLRLKAGANRQMGGGQRAQRIFQTGQPAVDYCASIRVNDM